MRRPLINASNSPKNVTFWQAEADSFAGLTGGPGGGVHRWGQTGTECTHVKWPALSKHSHQTQSRRQSQTHMAKTVWGKKHRQQIQELAERQEGTRGGATYIGRFRGA